MSVIDYLPLGLSLVMVGALLWWLAQVGQTGKLPRNGVVGIRTASTMQSDAAWEAGHRAAAPAVRYLALAQMLGGVLTLALGWFAQSPLTIPLGIGILLLTGIALVVVTATSVKTAANLAHQERLENQSRKL